jgi:hypothetical protein
MLVLLGQPEMGEAVELEERSAIRVLLRHKVVRVAQEGLVGMAEEVGLGGRI